MQELVLHLIETIFAEQMLGPQRPLGIFIEIMEGREELLSKAAIICIVEFDERMIHWEKGKELSLHETVDSYRLDNMEAG